MNNNYYAPVCRRTDGSVYLDRNRFWKDFLGGAAAILLLSLLFTAIVLCDLFDPFDVETQRHENIRRTGEARENYLAKSVE